MYTSFKIFHQVELDFSTSFPTTQPIQPSVDGNPATYLGCIKPNRLYLKGNTFSEASCLVSMLDLKCV